ncbi:E3 ubiquitin-protein ligase Mdm2 [Labrus mixtus]|uniref:E3 ubiquitin-protein ligase Mdm2 n=1 Tax=Labrus mixtus TaxID=508554 RepID=UPI0029C0CC1E|nr:E3 ubiquitin-protein ligase Mdm2 [Labrus mixtus]XP_060886089.1 E3 ubiquitin-protein ligase Mdm2 [Labrus mixtus]
MSAERELNTNTPDDNKLVRPKVEFQTLLQLAGATKDVFTMKEVMFYLGQYIIQKQLYDQKQQHIVHCSQDALGQVLGVDSFSVKETRLLFTLITKNLVAVKSQESSQNLSESQSNSQPDRGTEEADSESRSSSPDRRRGRRRRRRSNRSSDPGPSGPSHSLEDDEDTEETQEEEDEGGRKRRRSDSYSLTFDESLSWCVIGGLRDRHSSQSSDAHSTSARSEVTVAASDSDCDNFSVEFEVESIDSDDYNEDDASLSADDQVYEVTIIEEEEEDSFDEDTEITEADYWRCAKCEELNPPLPRHCLRCWTLQQDWLPKDALKSACSSPKALPLKPADQSAAKEALGSDVEETEGVDVPDGKRAKTPTILSPCLSDSASSAPNSQDFLSSCSQPSSSSSQQKLWSSDSQPNSSVDSQELLPLSPSTPTQPPPGVPDLDRSVSAEWRLPDSCLDPCLICQSRPKNGCIVHGRTGHLMSCYVCARKLKKRNKLCPVCRLPIQSVILTYIS